MNKRVLALGAAAAMGALAFAGPGLAGPEYRNKYPNESQVQECPDSDDSPDTVTYNGPTRLWPPNHKFQYTEVVAMGDPDDEVSLEVKVTPTDEVGGDGGPNHDPDVTYDPLVVDEEQNAAGADGPNPESALVIVGLRAERSGRGDGRTYDINWAAEFSENTCSGVFTVFVPHDMGNPADRAARTNGSGKQ